MNERKETASLNVCTDCLMYLANGEVTNGDGDDITQAHGEAIASVWGDDFDITLGVTDCEYCPDENGEECEPSFSWQRCDGCGSTLGGDRSHATAWVDPS